MSDDLNEPITEEDFDEALGRVERTLAERKAAERPYVIPGLDVPWWTDWPPYKVWSTGAGLVGALTPGPMVNMNGYVLLPPKHPWRDLDLQFGEVDIPVHGGVTFGPHVTGWIGFDTGHNDDWDFAELDALDPPISADLRKRWQQMINVDRGLGLGLNLGAHSTDDHAIHWTLPKIIAEVEHLAQLALEAGR